MKNAREKVNTKTVNALRKTMGTLPDQNPEFKTEFYRGVTGMKNSVKLIDYPVNPYKAMYTLATSCWGKHIDKWSDTTPQGRFMVVLSVLKKQALPLAYEAAQFTFACERIPRWAFDQIARARLGVVFSSQGTRDNNHLDAGFFVHDEIADNPELMKAFTKAAKSCKDVYKLIVENGIGSWQAARSILPISNTHAFSMSANFAALQGMLSNRLKFCEADATVAFAWLVREEINKKFPLLGSMLKPGCDFVHKCTYSDKYKMSELFGRLFSECGRHPTNTNVKYAEFNRSCSNRKTISKQLNIHIPVASEMVEFTFKNYDKLVDSDKKLFEEK